MVAAGSRHAHQIKGELFAAGYASFSDSMYVAMRVLEEHPSIRERVASRFDELIVDEVQDTSAVQLACLTLLRSSGKLASLVLIGDPDQAIYEYQGSDPEACRAFAAEQGLGTMELTRNYRSSQAICNITHRLSSRSLPEDAVGEAKDFDIAPEIILYDPSDLASAIPAFQSRLHAHSVAADPMTVCLCGAERSRASSTGSAT